MEEEKFNYALWSKKAKAAKKESKSSAVMNQVVSDTREKYTVNELYTKVGGFVDLVERRGVDLTQGYERWRNIGFALVDGLGELGREYYQRLSALNPNYDKTDCDKQYDACLNSRGSGITINSLFHYGSEMGINLSEFARQFSFSQVSPQIPQFEVSGEMEATISYFRPTFSDTIPVGNYSASFWTLD